MMGKGWKCAFNPMVTDLTLQELQILALPRWLQFLPSQFVAQGAKV